MGEMNGKFTSSTNALSGCGRDCDALALPSLGLLLQQALTHNQPCAHPGERGLAHPQHNQGQHQEFGTISSFRSQSQLQPHCKKILLV